MNVIGSYRNPKVLKLLDNKVCSNLTEYDWRALAVVALDQSGASLRTQARVLEILEEDPVVDLPSDRPMPTYLGVDKAVSEVVRCPNCMELLPYNEEWDENSHLGYYGSYTCWPLGHPNNLTSK